MNKKDTITLKEIHVNQQFYQQLINGFNQEISQEEKKGKQPLIMPSKQASYYKRRVLPIIMKQVQKGQLIQKYYTDIYQNRKKTCLQSLRQGFVECFAFLQTRQEQIQEELDIKQKDSSNMLSKIIKIGRWYRTIKKITVAFSVYKTASKTILSKDNIRQIKYLQDQSYSTIQKQKLEASILDTEPIIKHLD